MVSAPTSLPPGSLFPIPLNYDIKLGTGQSAGIMGGKINPLYENREQYTPEQKKKIIAITIVAITAIAATALLIAGCLTGIMPLIFVAIPLFAVAIGVGIWYLLARKADLDSPANRHQIRLTLAPQSFDRIVKNYEFQDIVGYQLLDGINIANHKRKQFYTNVTQLKEGYDRVKSEFSEDSKQIENTYHNGIAPLTQWRNDQAFFLRQRNAVYDAISSPIYYGRHHHHFPGHHHHYRYPRHHHLYHPRPLATIGSMALHYDAQLTMAYVNQEYVARIIPWNEWKRSELSKINKAYQEAMIQVQTQFDSMKAAAA